MFAEGEHCTAVEFRVNALYDAPDMLAVLDEYNLGGLVEKSAEFRHFVRQVPRGISVLGG